MRKMRKLWISPSLFTFLFFLLMFSCGKEGKQLDEEDNPVPTVIAQAVTSITSTSAIGGGVIINAGTDDIIARGVCWCIGQTPTISNSKTSDGTGSGSYFSNITGLLPNTSYNLRAYATNDLGTGYSNVVTFKTTN